jgi:hypothetical protein
LPRANTSSLLYKLLNVCHLKADEHLEYSEFMQKYVKKTELPGGPGEGIYYCSLGSMMHAVA